MVSNKQLCQKWQQNPFHAFVFGTSEITHTHNHFTAGLEYVRVLPGQQVPER